MLFPYKNNPKKDQAKKDSIRSVLLLQLDQANNRLQYQCSRWLECKTAHWSRKSWISVLVLFILLTSGYNMYVIVGSFAQSTNNYKGIGPVSKPAIRVQIDDGKDNIKVTVSTGEYEKAVRFPAYMDSLGRSPTGKKIKDSNTVKRP